MKILVVGDGSSQIHEVAVARSFMSLGFEVNTFYWHKYFIGSGIVAFWKKFQNKYLVGPIIRKLNIDLIKYTSDFEPNLIFIYRGTHIHAETILKLKSNHPSTLVFAYNNDNPFGNGHPFWLWRHFLCSVPKYDLVFAYRPQNIPEYISIGAKKVELLMPWFVPKTANDINLKIEYKHDVVFIGHYENDYRLKCLEEISKLEISFGLYGPDWNRAAELDWLNKYQPIRALKGDNYDEMLRSSKIALCFFSTLNKDTFTRRCFEIPALGVFLLCQYSEDLAKIFKPEEEIVFFYSPQDMIAKIKFYLNNDLLRNKIAKAGQLRVIRDGHDINSRVKHVIKFLREYD